MSLNIDPVVNTTNLSDFVIGKMEKLSIIKVGDRLCFSPIV